MCRSHFVDRNASLRAGLTLVELVVVLAILAVLAGVAVRSLEPIADQARFEATQKTLNSAKNAIVEDRLQASGTRHVSGFVSDMGLLPQSTAMLIDQSGNTEFLFADLPVASRGEASSDESLASGRSLDRLEVRDAVLNGSREASNLSGLTSVAFHSYRAVQLNQFSFRNLSGPEASAPPANPTNVDCSGVALRCGWRGPYLNVTDPASGLVDGWGRQIGLGPFPSAGGDVHLLWTAVSTQYSDQTINVQREAIQTVSGFIQDMNGAAKAAQVVLVYPNPELSTTSLSVMADADGADDSRFQFDNVPVGVRALVFNEVGGSGAGSARQAIRYIEVTPMQQANLTIRITDAEF